jgi:hypothetical protein
MFLACCVNAQNHKIVFNHFPLFSPLFRSQQTHDDDLHQGIMKITFSTKLPARHVFKAEAIFTRQMRATAESNADKWLSGDVWLLLHARNILWKISLQAFSPFHRLSLFHRREMSQIDEQK